MFSLRRLLLIVSSFTFMFSLVNILLMRRIRFHSSHHMLKMAAYYPKWESNTSKLLDKRYSKQQVSPYCDLENFFLLKMFKSKLGLKSNSLRIRKPGDYYLQLHRSKINITTKRSNCNNDQDRILNQINLNLTSVDKEKGILIYFHNKQLNDEHMAKENCPVKNCKFYHQKSYFQQSDAVIFRQLPENLTRPESKPNQIWIYYELESPEHSFPVKSNTKINWTATYRSDSTINTPYEKFIIYDKPKPVPTKKTIFRKSKLLAWFVSNCNARNNRFEYAKQLQKYMKVDIYGKCGHLKCRSGSGLNLLREKYKFYLAFENSNCNEYITEKFFNALKSDVVPVVMGARLIDYTKIAPPNSFIHVDSFNSPKELAAYLNLLDHNDSLYQSYFQWKHQGEFINTKFLCRLCAMVNLAPSVTTWYNDVDDWWKRNQCRPMKF